MKNAFLLLVCMVNFMLGQSTEFKEQIIVKDSILGGSLTIESEPGVAAYLNKNEKSSCYVPPKVIPKTNTNTNSSTYKPPVVTQQQQKVESSEQHKQMQQTDAWCQKYPKVMGYKIQIYYTKDKNAAIAYMNAFRKRMPGLPPPELVFHSPDYKIQLGDYLSRQSAAADLKRIKAAYPSAFAVQAKVWCRKAK
ncbi:MAG: hypothetical protein C4K58_02520 [Flavobacteriaceae bacterium]|nr:MAG: hypothetical protein C4K58_02520 [Flavobacteriaceae bacterium]